MAAACCVAASLACNDPLAVKATLAVQTDTLVAFALSGTSPIFPAALNTAFRSVVRVDATHNYDVAFDLDDQGNVRVIPVRLMGGATTATRRVGIQKSAQAFDALTKAPSGGYVYDSVAVVRPGEAFALELTSQDQCVYSYSVLLYSKVGIDSVNTTSRQIFFRVTHDPNCGFRSFLPGLPKN
ncbi:MAG: hypothetical protein MNPFHGCM_01527 [Gemmatimonadaceae bacterium]|nr:hypothetical protein [Gemmatimonadaceae bacterium]